MATAPQPESLFNFMQFVTTCFMVVTFVVVVYLLFKQVKKFRTSKIGLGRVFFWLGLAFIGLSVLLYTTAGPTVSLFIDGTLNLGYPKPITLAFDTFIIGGVFMVAGLITSVLMREHTPKEPKAPRGRKSTISDRKAAKPAQMEHMGTEFFADQIS